VHPPLVAQLVVRWAVRPDRRVPKVAALRVVKRVPRARTGRRVLPPVEREQAVQAAAVIRALVAQQAAAHSSLAAALKAVEAAALAR
jgi:hypothetical protein